MSLDMGYDSITKFYKTLKFNWLCSKRQMQRKMDRLNRSRYIALPCDSCNARRRLTSSML